MAMAMAMTMMMELNEASRSKGNGDDDNDGKEENDGWLVDGWVGGLSLSRLHRWMGILHFCIVDRLMDGWMVIPLLACIDGWVYFLPISFIGWSCRECHMAVALKIYSKGRVTIYSND